MRKEAQTEELKVRVYNLTLSFVRKYQPRYYKQFRGAQEDLTADFYCQFLTPKSRIKGKEESLLDKYDDTITSLEYLLKISVQRMLIDRSRQDSHPFKSIDAYIDEYGDLMTANFGLVTTDEEESSVDNKTFNLDFMLTVCAKYDKLTEAAKQSVIRQFEEIKDVIAPNYRELFEAAIDADPVEPEQPIIPIDLQVVSEDGISDYNVQQITPKTICVFHEDEVKLFNRITGEARGKAYRNLSISDESLSFVLTIDTFHSEMQLT